jgi:formylmethanofuran dehydrogenase subunit E
VGSKEDSFSSKKKEENNYKSSHCFACGKIVIDPKEANRLGDEIICDACREEMFSSLEEAWVKHSAFLDSALN